ncbi:MAG: YqhA family protein, partial [Muribaculaceae bacterium]|nr:YqhA family protein [Muribaculaceae bacterium]
MNEYKQLRNKILNDGRLTKEEVDLLRTVIYDEEGMTLEKANFLFQLKELATKGDVSQEFLDLFVDAITLYLLEDEDSPGEIDESEAKWLRAKIQYNGHLDEYDNQLLKNLKRRSINFPKVLQYKSLHTRTFENLLYSSRYLSILAVIGAIVSAVALFIEGSIIVFHAIADFSALAINGAEVNYEELFEHLVSSVDVFLFALVLIIFGVGVYE